MSRIAACVPDEAYQAARAAGRPHPRDQPDEAYNRMAISFRATLAAAAA